MGLKIKRCSLGGLLSTLPTSPFAFFSDSGEPGKTRKRMWLWKKGRKERERGKEGRGREGQRRKMGKKGREGKKGEREGGGRKERKGREGRGETKKAYVMSQI